MPSTCRMSRCAASTRLPKSLIVLMSCLVRVSCTVLLHSKMKEHTQIVGGEKKTVKRIKQNGAKLDTGGFTGFPKEVVRCEKRDVPTPGQGHWLTHRRRHLGWKGNLPGKSTTRYRRYGKFRTRFGDFLLTATKVSPIL